MVSFLTFLQDIEYTRRRRKYRVLYLLQHLPRQVHTLRHRVYWRGARPSQHYISRSHRGGHRIDWCCFARPDQIDPWYRGQRCTLRCCDLGRTGGVLCFVQICLLGQYCMGLRFDHRFLVFGRHQCFHGRPCRRCTMKECHKNIGFNVVVYTASSQQEANQIIFCICL